MEKHTKGNWDKVPQSVNGKDIILDGMYCFFVESKTTALKLAIAIGFTEEEAEANAKLISASPELLEALIEVEEWASKYGLGQRQYNKVISAIKKATQ
jgi:hypothetical protein